MGNIQKQKSNRKKRETNWKICPISRFSSRSLALEFAFTIKSSLQFTHQQRLENEGIAQS